MTNGLQKIKQLQVAEVSPAVKVAFLAGTLGCGGAERQLYYMLKALLQRENAKSLGLIFHGHGEFFEAQLRSLGVRVASIGYCRSKILKTFRIFRIVRQWRPRFLQSAHCYMNLYASMVARFVKAVDVGAVRSNGLREIDKSGAIIGRLQLRLPQLLVVNSSAAMKNIVQFGVREQRMHLVPNCVDIDEFYPSDELGDCAGASRTRGVRVLGVGRLSKVKRFDRFVRVVGGVRKIGVVGRLVGAGAERQELERVASNVGMGADGLEFVGEVYGIAKHYRDSEILLHTAEAEGTPNVILEAMASGLPIVATSVGGTQEVVEDGVTGFLTEPGDEEKMGECIRRLVANPEMRLQMGAAGRKRVVEWHSEKVVARALDVVYRSSLGEV